MRCYVMLVGALSPVNHRGLHQGYYISLLLGEMGNGMSGEFVYNYKLFTERF